MQFKTLHALTILLVSVCLSACDSGGSSALDNMSQSAVPVDPPFINEKVSCQGFKVKLSQQFPWSVSPPSDWVVMGSSSAFGAGASSPEKSWVGLLKSATIANTAKIHNLAKGGHSTYQALSQGCVVNTERPKTDPAHNFEKALEFKPDLVILSYPSNDASQNYSATETAANLLLLRWQFSLKNIPVLILSAQPRNMAKELQQKLVEVDQILRPLLGPCYVDLYTKLVDSQGNLSNQFNAGDGVHLNNAGHQIVFEAVSQRLASGQCVVIN